MIFLAACVTFLCLGGVYGADSNDTKEIDVLHPSEDSMITCNKTGTCGGGPCQYTATMINKGDPLQSSIGTPLAYECGDLKGQWAGSPKNGSTLATITTNCYQYNSSNHTFNAIEVLITLPSNTTNMTVLWNDGKDNTTEFKRTSTEVDVVFGIPDDCYKTPDVITTTAAPKVNTTTTPGVTTASPNSTSGAPPTTTPTAGGTTGSDDKTDGSSGGSSGSRTEHAILGLVAALLALRFHLSN